MMGIDHGKPDPVEIVQDAAGELGLAVPTSVVGNITDVVQLSTSPTRSVTTSCAIPNGNGSPRLTRFTTSYLTTTGDTTNGSAVITNIPSTATLAANT